MALTTAQRSELEALSRAADDLRSAARRAAPDKTALASQWLAEDVRWEAAPLASLSVVSTESPVVRVPPDGEATLQVRVTYLRLHVVDRTGFPMAAVECEIWSQALGVTDGDGSWTSPAIARGSYALKLRRGRITAPECARDAKVVGAEYATTVSFTGGRLLQEIKLSLSAADLPILERAEQILLRCALHLPDAARDQLRALISGPSLAVIGGSLVLWIVGHATGGSEIADAAAALAAFISTGIEAAMAIALAKQIVECGKKAAFAENEFDLDDAGKLLADVALTLGVMKLFDALGKVVKKQTSNRVDPVIPEEKLPPAEAAAAEDVAAEEAAAAKRASRMGVLAKSLRSMMGDAVYESRLTAVRDAVAKHPQYANIPEELLVALRGYTEKNRETALAARFGRFRGKDALGDFAILNSAARRKDAAALAELADYIRAVDQALEKLPIREGRAFRGLGLDEFMSNLLLKRKGRDALKTKLFYSDNGFASTSSESSVAVDFMKRQTWATSHATIICKCFSGRDVAWLSEYPKEAELLMPSGTRLVITRRTFEGGIWTIEMLELRPDLDVFVRVWGKGVALRRALEELDDEQQQAAEKEGGAP